MTEDNATQTADVTPEVTAPATETTEQQTTTGNPFDFTANAAKQETPQDAATQTETTTDYAPDYGANWRGTDDERVAITDLAQKAGLSVEGAGKFVSSVLDYYTEKNKENNEKEFAALQELWGKDFDKKLGATCQALNQFANEMGLDNVQRQAYMRPEAFLLVNHLLSRLGEHPSIGVNSPAPAISGKAEYDRIMGDPENEVHDILLNPNHPKYRETADKMNALAGIKLY